MNAVSGTARIVADYDRCQGNGVCTFIAPDLFDLDDDANLIIRVEHPADDRLEDVEEAVTLCPMQALALVHER